jgi:hypothetical protein
MVKNGTNMNEVIKLYNDDGCVLKYASSNDYESWSSAKTLGSTERREEYRNLCYNFEYEWGTNTLTVQRKEYVMRIVNT